MQRSKHNTGYKASFLTMAFCLSAFVSATANAAVRPGFDSQALPANDDLSTGLVSMGFTIDFFGIDYTDLYVNNNGNVTFDLPLSTFTPFDLTSTGRVIIAPFFADVDTRLGNIVSFGVGTADGHPAFGVNWPDVGCYFENISVLNDFQLVLIDRSDISIGDFDMEFNFDRIEWETGEASGGDGNCLGGSAARVGFSNGSGDPGTSYELPGSAVPGAFLDSNLVTGLIHNSLNSNVIGRYVFRVRNGIPEIGEPFEKLLSDGPDVDGNGEIDLSVLAPSAESISYTFKIKVDPARIDGESEGLLVLDSAPAEWDVTCVFEDEACDNSPVQEALVSLSCGASVQIGEVNLARGGKAGKNCQSDTDITWVPDNENPTMLSVELWSRLKNKAKQFYSPTGCGPLPINAGAILADAETGEVLYSTGALVVAAVMDVDGDGSIDPSGNGDEDGDGLSDLAEVRNTEFLTDPCNFDTDGDGVGDGDDACPLAGDQGAGVDLFGCPL